MKPCTICERELDESEFYRKKSGYLFSECKQCNKDQSAVRRKIKQINNVLLSDIRIPGYIKKACPSCRRFIYVDPSPGVNNGICLKCNLPFTITHTFSNSIDSGKTGGIKLWAVAEKQRDVFNKPVFQDVSA